MADENTTTGSGKLKNGKSNLSTGMKRLNSQRLKITGKLYIVIGHNITRNRQRMFHENFLNPITRESGLTFISWDSTSLTQSNSDQLGIRKILKGKHKLLGIHPKNELSSFTPNIRFVFNFEIDKITKRDGSFRIAWNFYIGKKR